MCGVFEDLMSRGRMKISGAKETILHSEYEKEFNDKVDKSLWESDSQTIERVVEILFNWFRDHGKLKDLKPDETWKSLMNDIVAATMHEG